MTAPELTTPELLARLRRHYIKPGTDLPGGIFLPEVTLGRAGGARCDAIHVGFTSTSGRIITGHELKISRADWRRELDDPHKADAWADECHAWTIVAPSTEVVPVEELPHGWGLMVIDPRTRIRLKTVVKPAVRGDAHRPSWIACLSLLAKFDTIRAAEVTRRAGEIETRIRAGIDERVERELRVRGTSHARDEATRARLREIMDALDLREIIEPGHYRHRDDVATLDDLRELAPLLRCRGALQRSLETLTGRYSTPTAALRNALGELDTALVAIARARGEELTVEPDGSTAP